MGNSLSHYELVVGALVFVATALFLRRQFSSESLPDGVRRPPFAPGFPYLGNVPPFVSTPVSYIVDLHKKLGDCFTIRLGPRHMVFLCSPEGNQFWCKSPENVLSFREAYRPALDASLGPEAFVMQLPHSQQIKMMKSVLTVGKLKRNVPKLESFFTRVLERDGWGESGEFDAFAKFNFMILEAASVVLCAPEIEGNQRFLDEYQFVANMTVSDVIFSWAPTPSNIRRRNARNYITKEIRRIMGDRRNSPSGEFDDFVNSLMGLQAQLYDKGDQSRFIDDMNVSSLVLGFIFVSHVQTYVTAAWTLANLLKNPEAMKEVMDEQRAFEATGEELRFEHVHSWEAMKRCLKESIRMYSPILLLRVLMSDRQCGEFMLRKGETIAMSPYISHRNPKYYPKPSEYDPSRWLPENDHSNDAPFAWVGFGGGVHGCLGEQFSMVEMAILLSVLLRRYNMKLTSELPQPDVTKLEGVMPNDRPAIVKFTSRRRSGSES